MKTKKQLIELVANHEMLELFDALKKLEIHLPEAEAFFKKAEEDRKRHQKNGTTFSAEERNEDYYRTSDLHTMVVLKTIQASEKIPKE